MNKRSAMLVAAGLVAALLAGGTALSFSLAGGTAVAQDGRVEPIVRTERRTVTIHKKADPKPAQVVTIAASTPPTDASSSVSSAGDDGFGGETETQHESETEHESESWGSDQTSSDDDSGSGGSGEDD
jgi:hypothetical protein